MFNEFVRITELDSSQNRDEMETIILGLLKNNRVSLSQARGLFLHILERIEDDNFVNM